MQQQRIVAFLALLLVVAAVHGVANTALAQDSDVRNITETKVKKSPPPNVAGSWCGPVKDNDLGSGQINLSINQSGKQLSGSWSDDFGGSGSLTGKINGTAVSAKLRDQANKCKLQVNGTLVSPGEITGTYSQFGCHQADGGSFDITSPTC
jgi:hypothetical protein